MFFIVIDMAYLQNWRKYHTFVHALAQPSSSEDDSEIQHPESDVQHVTPQRNTPSSQSDSEEDLDPQDAMADYESDSSGSVVIASDLENETVEEESLPSQIAEWATKYKCTKSCIHHMLEIFRKQGHRVPKDSRPLLQTPQAIDSIRKWGVLLFWTAFRNHENSIVTS